MADNLLTVRDIDTFYGDSQGLFGMSLAVGRGEMVSLLGRNGMGKTTTVRSILGLTPARRGVIRFDGADIRTLPPFRIARQGIGLVPEGRQIFPRLTVRENLIATANLKRNGRPPWTLSDIFDLFPILGDRRNHLGNQLSGGEQQMLAIGRALMIHPRLLILDEATEGLAPLVRAEIWRCLAQLRSEGLSILVIDKNVEALSRICDRHFIAEKGRVVWQGTSAELNADPTVRTDYLGV